MLHAVLFISGFCSLLYQVVWQRLFGLVCSSDNVTASLVVAAFLAGIGLGNLFAARICAFLTPRRAFRALALCETLITVFAFVSPMLYYDMLFAYFLKSSLSQVETFLILFASLLPPTFLMGASLPLLGKGVVRSAENTGTVLSGLYAANILGAGSGAFIASFLLLGTLGMEFSLYFGGGLNLCIALALWLMPHRFRDGGVRGEEASRSWRVWLAIIVVVVLQLIGANNVFLNDTLMQLLLPGFFLAASAYVVFGWRFEYATLPGKVSLLLFGMMFAAFAEGGTYFLPASALWSLSLTCRKSETWLTRFLPLCAVVLVAWLASRAYVPYGWNVFHYFTGLVWLLGGIDAEGAGGRTGRSVVQSVVAALAVLGLGLASGVSTAQIVSLMIGCAAFAAILVLNSFEPADIIRKSSAYSRLAVGIFFLLVVLLWQVSLTSRALLVIVAGIVCCVALLRSSLAEPDANGGGHSPFFWMVLAFLAGFVAVALELVWFRTIFTYFYGNSYVFGPMLGIYLLSDGLGMWVSSKLLPYIRNSLLAFFATQIAIIFSSLTAYLVILDLPRFRLTMINMSVFTFILLGVPCFFMGFTFPFIQQAIQDRDEQIGSRIGLILFSNTLGNAAGGLVAAFVLLGFLGTMNSLVLLTAFAVGAAGYCIIGKKAVLPSFVSCGLVAYLCIALPSNIWFWQTMHGASASHSETAIVTEDYSGVCLITVHTNQQKYYLDSDATEYGTLFVSGYRQGDIPFGQSQTTSGVLGSAFHPDPKEVMCIGVGSAATPYLLGMRQSISKIEMVELAAAEIPALEAASRRGFGRFLRTIFEDPRYVLHIADGRKVLFNSGKYDIIQADMRTAESAGSGAIYSREFYLQALKHLKPNGYFVQQLFGPSVLDTMRTVFPYTYSYRNFAIGAGEPLDVTRDALLRYTAGELSQRLRAANMEPERVVKIITDYMADGDFILHAPLNSEDVLGRINTDLLPRDEFYMNNPIVLPSLLGK